MTDYSGKRAVALVSGGLDSLVSLAKANAEMDVRLVLFFDYGQRALAAERAACQGIVDFYGCPWKIVDMRWLGTLAPEAMREATTPPGVGEVPLLDTLDAVWIPNRNGAFLNIGAAYAEAYDCEFLVTGFNREEAVEFPDNSEDYVERVNAALELSTRNGVRAVSFTQHLDKKGIIELGHELRAPLSVVWSCYHSGERMCGRCASCARLKAALANVDADVRPPIEFEG